MPGITDARSDLYIVQDPANQNWYLQFANTRERLLFAGATQEEREANVEAMAELMKMGQRENWSPLFDGLDGEVTADNLLSGVQRVFYEDQVDPVWEAEETEDALGSMVEVGELLLEALL